MHPPGAVRPRQEPVDLCENQHHAHCHGTASTRVCISHGIKGIGQCDHSLKVRVCGFVGFVGSVGFVRVQKEEGTPPSLQILTRP